MFENARSSFNQDIRQWNISKFRDTEDMFEYENSYTFEQPKKN